jgi:hypothetical protein
VEVVVIKGGQNFNDLITNSFREKSILNNYAKSFDYFSDDEYLYVHATGKAQGAYLQFQVTALADKVAPPPPPPTKTPPNTPP